MASDLIATALLILVLAWGFYPAAMWLVGSLRRRPQAPPSDAARGCASVVIATRDDPAVVSRRVANLEALRHELDDLEIVVAVDRRSPIEFERYRQALGSRAVVVDGDDPGAKAVTLNAGVRAATHEIILFTDSNQEFLPGTLAGLVHAVQQPGIGAATGRIALENNRRSLLLMVFWTYESWLRKIESTVDSIIGVTGAIYALRKALWEPLPAGLINDDVFVALAVAHQGARVVTCESAFAIDRRKFTAREEFRRKVRTLTGVLQLCVLRPSLLNPLKNRLWVQFVFHKLLRFSTPYWLLLAVLGVALAYPMQCAAITLAVLIASVMVTFTSPKSSLISRIVRQAGWSALLLSAPFVATVNGLRGRWNVWDASARGAK
jgi:cellulose synthase/poly-beta-1,6-N-acetylglucosamine synthase-like glycosyltransferase